MSLSKIAEMLGLPSPEELEKTLHDKFPSQFGRYESVSGKLYIEIWHHSPSKINWRKGSMDKVLEEEVLDYPEAIDRFQEHMSRGFLKAFSATTDEDMKRERAKVNKDKSLLARTNYLGTYRLDGEFMRVHEFAKDVFFIEYGKDTAIYETKPNLTETQARELIDRAMEAGYVRDGQTPIRSNASMFFNDDPKPVPQTKEVSWDMLDGFFD